ncbi:MULTISPECIES: SAVED domain-containing protein [unclassified Streptomyces]|uniref:SAVED domain-containing protein n=1 Tax=unclassified Streptomyces TaxID=2593676 RepID=UPI001F526AF3|nr:SAVED domain-containing protein [Streptomyces sp. CB02058]
MLCNAYLLEGALSARTLNLGELAHIVGQGVGARSPRGEYPLDPGLRDGADNLMLLCERHHGEVDAQRALDVFTVEQLRRLKREHEDRIRHVTGLGPERATAVVRMLGSVHGRAVELSRETAAEAVTAQRRFPLFLESYDRHGVEIDLRQLPGERPVEDVVSAAAGSRAYYGHAVRVIDEVLEHRLRAGVERGAVQHVSVFGFARLPLLVYLGARLDDTVPTEVFQRHRAEESWRWPDESGVSTRFEARVDQDVPAGDEAVVVVNVSGAIGRDEVPGELSMLRRYVISPVGVATGPDILCSRASLGCFEDTLRGFLALLEAEAKTVRRLHVLPAVPMSAAVALGRAHHFQVHPQWVIYERLAGSYVPTLEVGRSAG